MLTRLEVDGFKNLLRFEVDFGPFNCIAGPNGVGKSNIFDAIRFLSLLADNSIRDAALKVRGNPNTADERDLFWTDGKDRADSEAALPSEGSVPFASFRIAAEMVVSPHVFDDLEQQVEALSTYLRYEVEIGYSEPDLKIGKLGGLSLLSETLHDYTLEEAKERLRFPVSEEFFEAIVYNKKGKRTNFISTNFNKGQREIIIHPNGTGTVPPKIVPAAKIPRTIIAASGIWTEPTILAARREMQSFQILAMEPTAIRPPDPLRADPHLTINGGHLHATLYRMATTAAIYDCEPEDIYARVGNRLSNLLTVWGLSVDVDPVRQLLTIEVEQRFSGGKVPARSLSDGALRFLTLAVLSEDPDFHGLVCIEEPENGIHPSQMGRLVDLLQEMAVDPTFEPSWEEGNPMRQVIIATHSPYLVQLQEKDDLLIAVKLMTSGPKGKPTNTLECWPLPGTWRCSEDQPGVGWARILDYLVGPEDARLKLPSSLLSN